VKKKKVWITGWGGGGEKGIHGQREDNKREPHYGGEYHYTSTSRCNLTIKEKKQLHKCKLGGGRGKKKPTNTQTETTMGNQKQTEPRIQEKAFEAHFSQRGAQGPQGEKPKENLEEKHL